MANPTIDSLFSGDKTHVEFRKYQNFTGRISKHVYQELYQRGCIEVQGLPPVDLKNAIHPIFSRQAFTDISDNEYERIRPAITLASRFITEDEYMGFWTHMCTGRSVDDDRAGKEYIGEWRVQVIEEASTDSKEALKQTQQTLLDLANNLTFFILDEEWSTKDLRVAESFMDPCNRYCRRNGDITGADCDSGECAHCDAVSQARCRVCDTSDYASKTVPELLELLQERNIPHAYKMHGPDALKEKVDIIAALEDLDEVMEEDPLISASEFRTTDEQLSNIQVGLHWDVLKHIRKASEDEVWTQSEEIRFQMAVAATLCHELVHIFWWWAQRGCPKCEEFEPWWSKTEVTFAEEPELGESWEYWAFGSRVPCAGKLHAHADQDLPNIFQRCQWNWVNSTEQGGQDRHNVLIHDFILPVEYINSWFQESTWEAIAQHGRKVGRPSHDNVVILRERPTDLVNEEEFGNHECTIEGYSHSDLVANGGFNGRKRKFLYGATGLTTTADTRLYIKRLRTELSQRLLKEKKAEAQNQTTDGQERTRPAQEIPRAEGSTDTVKTGRVTKKKTRARKPVKDYLRRPTS